MLQGSLRVKSAQNAVAATRNAPTKPDDYLSQLAKLFPAEILSIYPAGMALLKAAKVEQTWWFASLCVVAIVAVRLIATAPQPTETGRPQYAHIAIAVVSFLLWVVAIGDWFLPVSPPGATAKSIAAAIALIWTWLAPQIGARFE